MDPMSSDPRPLGVSPWENTPETNGDGMDMEEGKADTVPSARIPRDACPPSPAAVPVPASPALSAQVLSSPFLSVQLPAPAHSLDRNSVQFQAPAVGRTPYDERRWDRHHEQCTRGGYCRKYAHELSKTRLRSMDVAEAKRISVRGGEKAASGTISGEGERVPV